MKKSKKLPVVFISRESARSPATIKHHLDCEMDTPERRALSLAEDGLPDIPALGLSRYRAIAPHLPEHVHPGCLEINFCQRGSLMLRKKGRDHELRPGNVFVAKPDEPHYLVKNSKGLLMYWMIVKLPMCPVDTPMLNLPRLESVALTQSLENLPNSTFAAEPKMANAFRKLFRLYDSNERGPSRSVRMRSLVLNILLSLVDYGEKPVTVKQIKRLDPIISEIKDHPESSDDLGSLAAKTGLSKTRFSTLFKQVTGYPPHAFRLLKRIERAQEYLRNTQMQIETIAQRLSFATPRHFADVFRGVCGVSPSAYRNGLANRRQVADPSLAVRPKR